MKRRRRIRPNSRRINHRKAKERVVVLVKEMKGMLEMIQGPMMEVIVGAKVVRKMWEMIPMTNIRVMVLWRSR